MPSTVLSAIGLFADDVYIYRWIRNIDDCKILQEDLQKLIQREQSWSDVSSGTTELARLILSHSIYWGQKFLPKCIIPERTRYTDIRFKPIYVRLSYYNHSFIPYTVKQWNVLPREVVNIKCSDHFTNSLTKYLTLQN